MSMPESSDVGAAASEPVAIEVGNQMANASQRITNMMLGAQKLLLEEVIFAGNQMLDRRQTEMHLFSEFVSKMASAHSVKDIRGMYEECGKHQIEFIRRDCDRFFKHGERMIDAASSLFKSHPLD